MKGLIEGQLSPDPFHPQQYGFRREPSTVDDIKDMVRFAQSCTAKNRICVMITLDVKNAFNCFGWDVILEELATMGVLPDVRNVLRDYFRDRRVTVLTPQERIDTQIAAGVTQGSVLGPFLWNLVYDGALRAVDPSLYKKVVAYADDLAVLLSARNIEQLDRMLSPTMDSVLRWFARTGLRVATNKRKSLF